MRQQLVEQDTIVAVATPSGVGGVGIVRVSGPKTKTIAEAILKTKNLQPKKVERASFWSKTEEVIDTGLAIYFKAPRSFTGEDVLELHAHGSPVILNLLLQEICLRGARIAEPGEFSKRAFLLGKVDLLQAESIASLIHAQTEQAARAAVKSLQGEFSKRVDGLFDFLLAIRMKLEAAINFPEDVNWQEDIEIINNVFEIKLRLENIIKTAKQGVLINKGVKVVLLGEPNVGKSSLLNFLSQREVAIVTEIPGTTRDVLTSIINIDGLLLEVADTAGIRAPQDKVEEIGIEKAKETAKNADLLILMLDAREVVLQQNVQANNVLENLLEHLPIKELIAAKKSLIVINKIDLQEVPDVIERDNVVCVSVTKSIGIDQLKQKLKKLVDFFEEAPLFSARKRHVDALEAALVHLSKSCLLLQQKENEIGFLAEELMIAQQYLSMLNGRSGVGEALLGKIFSEFCIGK